MRNLHRDAWFLYTVTSTHWFERCAQACEDFAEVLNRMLTGRGLHGGAKFDFWVQTYVDHASDIRRKIELIEDGDDWTWMHLTLNQPVADAKGLAEQPWGWMTTGDKCSYDDAFRKLSRLCGLAATVLTNNHYAGQGWLAYKDSEDPMEQKMLNRDGGKVGDLKDSVEFALKYDLVKLPDRYPTYCIDTSTSCRVGETCQLTGIWIPAEGLENFSLTFASEGRPMQPAYEIVGETSDPMGIMTSPITRAVDTHWYAVVPLANQPAEKRPRHNVPAGERCPETGQWFTPAMPASRRHFSKGDIFPGDKVTEYGYVFWQWASD